MAGRITKVLVVLAILQYTLRVDAQAVEATEEVLKQHEEQHSQMTWLAMAGRITKILLVLGILQYTARLDLPSVKVTEELLRQHEEQRSQEMAQLQEMEQRMQDQPGVTQGSVLLSACQQLSFWVCAEILLVLFGLYWLPRQRNAGFDSSSQRETTLSAQEQTEEEDGEDNPNPYDTPDKPPD